MPGIIGKDNGRHQGGHQGSPRRTMGASKRMLEFYFIFVYLNDRVIVNHDNVNMSARNAKKDNKNHNVH
jgi:hypothetical protein